MLTAIFIVAFTTVINGLDCDHYGPYPTGRCIAGFVVECVSSNGTLNNSTNNSTNNDTNNINNNGTDSNATDSEWQLEFTLYADEECSGNITLQTSFSCNEGLGCGCGLGYCTDDELMLIEFGSILDSNSTDSNSTDNNSTSTNTTDSCGNYIDYPLIKDACISAGEWLSPQDGMVAVELVCNEDNQTISYFGYSNQDCSGNPINRDPIIYLDLNAIDIPCVELLCNDFNDSSVNDTNSFNSTDNGNFEQTQQTGLLSTLSTFFKTSKNRGNN